VYIISIHNKLRYFEPKNYQNIFIFSGIFYIWRQCFANIL